MLFKTIIAHIQRSPFIPSHGRRIFLRAMGIRLGHRPKVKARVSFFSGNVEIGDKTFVNHECLFDDSARITIGNYVMVGTRVSFVTSSHETGPPEKRGGPNTAEPITIEDGCWIGSGAGIMPGVTIAKGCIIGAGAVVTKSTEPNGMYAGNPARRIKDLPRE